MGTVVWDINVPISRAERLRRAAECGRVIVLFYAYAAVGQRLR